MHREGDVGDDCALRDRQRTALDICVGGLEMSGHHSALRGNPASLQARQQFVTLPDVGEPGYLDLIALPVRLDPGLDQGSTTFGELR